MPSRRQQIETAASEIARPIFAELGLELLGIEFGGPGRSPVLRFLADRPGGVTLDELQRASQSVERALEVAEVVPGHYLLEVSSPGIDRPWKRLEDFRRHVGERATLKLFSPLPDGRRHLTGTLIGVEGDTVRFQPDSGPVEAIPHAAIASARPEVDWKRLLKGEGRGASGTAAPGREK